jgi:hypothetical protein
MPAAFSGSLARRPAPARFYVFFTYLSGTVHTVALLSKPIQKIRPWAPLVERVLEPAHRATVQYTLSCIVTGEKPEAEIIAIGERYASF